jgi:hypothetical protein
MFLKPRRSKYLRKIQIKSCNKKSPKVEKKDKICKRRKTTILENAKQTNKNVQRVSLAIDKYRKIYSVKVM